MLKTVLIRFLNQKWGLPVIGFLIGMNISAANGPVDTGNSLKEITRSLSLDSLEKHLRVLADDSMMGRAPGTRGARIAADYIRSCFQQYGLKSPDLINNYFQPVPMHGSMPLTDSRLRLYSENMVHDFELGEDYLLYRTGAQTFIGNPVPLVFAGYGIIAPEFDYNDYQSVDVAGKIVVCLSGEPDSDDSTYFSGSSPTIYSLPEAKHRMAISQGALGTILIASRREYKQGKWERWKREFSFEDVTLAYTVAGQLSVVMSPLSAELLFRNASFSLSDILGMADKHQLISFDLDGKISFKGEFIERDFISENVIGLLEGRHPDLWDTYIILTAHYDHLGIGPAINGDQIYNGAIDNASGVAGLLELARVFSRNPQLLDRSLVFIAVTGEEKGLLGSQYYLDHPVVPLYKSAANINIDGLAVFDCFHDVIGIGSDLSTLGQILERSTALLNLKVSTFPEKMLSMEAFSRSDQLAFAQAGIPSMLIMEGFDYENMTTGEAMIRMQQWLEQTYHTPMDDLNQEMNLEAALEHTGIIAATVFLLTQSTTIPEWKKGVPYRNIQLRNLAEKR